MTNRNDDTRKPAHDPKKAKDSQKDEVDLQVEELEERIAPMKPRP